MKKSSKTGNSTDPTKSETLDPEGNLMMDKVGTARKKSRMPPPTFDKVYFFCATLLLTIFLLIVCGIGSSEELDHDDSTFSKNKTVGIVCITAGSLWFGVILRILFMSCRVGSRKATFFAINTVVWLMGFSTIMLAVNRKEGKNSSLFAAMMITWYLFFCVITFKLWEYCERQQEQEENEKSGRLPPIHTSSSSSYGAVNQHV